MLRVPEVSTTHPMQSVHVQPACFSHCVQPGTRHQSQYSAESFVMKFCLHRSLIRKPKRRAPQKTTTEDSCPFPRIDMSEYIHIKVKCSRYRPGVAQRVGRGIAVLFHDRGTRRGWVVSSTPRPHFTPGKDPVPILQEAGWAPGPVWTGGKSRPHRDSIPDRPARSQSLYRLSYPAHIGVPVNSHYCSSPQLLQFLETWVFLINVYCTIER